MRMQGLKMATALGGVGKCLLVVLKEKWEGLCYSEVGVCMCVRVGVFMGVLYSHDNIIAEVSLVDFDGKVMKALNKPWGETLRHRDFSKIKRLSWYLIKCKKNPEKTKKPKNLIRVIVSCILFLIHLQLNSTPMCWGRGLQKAELLPNSDFSVSLLSRSLREGRGTGSYQVSDRIWGADSFHQGTYNFCWNPPAERISQGRQQ